MSIDKVSEHQDVFFIEHEDNYEHIILGHVVGIGLEARGRSDPHVCFRFLFGDDGYWRGWDESRLSSSWFKDVEDIIARATAWCKANCEPDFSGNRQYGWIFRKEQTQGRKLSG